MTGVKNKNGSPSSSEVPVYVPQEIWNDDNRMMGFMAMFKKREVNPADYDSKMKFWSQAVEHYCEHTRQPSVNLRTLQNAFQRGDRIPAGLSSVLEEMISSGRLQSQADFVSGADGWLSWGVKTFVKSPLYWLAGWNSTPANTQTDNLVCMDTIKILSHRLLDHHESMFDDNTSKVIEWHTLKRRCHDIFPDDNALNLTLIYLQKQHLLNIATGPNGEKIIKFRDTPTSKGPVAITEMDRNIINMKKALSKLDAEMESLEARQKQLDIDVRKCVREKQKTRAMQILRQKKLIEKKLSDKDTIYTNLYNLLQKLSDTDDQRQVLTAYKSGVAAFKSNLAKHGLSADDIDTTMDDIQDVGDIFAMSDYAEISEALASPSNFGLAADSDADELEAELNDLLDVERRDARKRTAEEPSKIPVATAYPSVPKEPRIELPSVPAESPSKGNAVRLDRLRQLREQLETA